MTKDKPDVKPNFCDDATSVTIAKLNNPNPDGSAITISMFLLSISTSINYKYSSYACNLHLLENNTYFYSIYFHRLHNLKITLLFILITSNHLFFRNNLLFLIIIIFTFEIKLYIDFYIFISFTIY